MNDILNDTGAKVLYASLQRMTDDRSMIKQAMQHWMTELSGHPFDVISTVASLEKYFGLSTQERKVLMIGMHAAASRASHQLSPVPDYVLGDGGLDPVGSATPQAQPDAPAPVKSKKAFIELSQAYAAQISREVRRINAGEFRELLSILADEGLSDVSKKTNAKLKKGQLDDLDLPRNLSETECQDFCHALYMLVAELIGPIDADTVSNKAIAELLNMEAAVRYDPRSLL